MLIMLLSLLILPIPLLTRFLLDEILPRKQILSLFRYGVLLILLVITVKIMEYIQNMLFQRINNRIILAIRLQMLDKVNHLPSIIRSRYENGYLMARINEDTTRLKSLFADTWTVLLKDLLTLGIGLTAIFYLEWKLALLVTGLLPIFVLLNYHYSGLIRRNSGEYYEQSARATHFLAEGLRTTELIRVFGRYRYSIYKYYKRLISAYRSNIILVRTCCRNLILSGSIAALVPVIILSLGGYLIIQGEMSLGTMIAFNSFTAYLFGPAGRLVGLNIQIQKSQIALRRIMDLLEIPEERITTRVELPEELNIELDGIYFYYEKTMPILIDLSLSINKGERIGIVGPSGCGKTTILKLLLGLYTPIKGSIRLNGRSVGQSELVALRCKAALVEQEPYLLQDTIYENIRFGNPRACAEEVHRAAIMSCADGFIRRYTRGYDTMIESGGTNLSVGQKQRIALARALVRSPQILLLDEITANVDVFNENKIMKTIYSLPPDLIILIIAHKASLLEGCSKVYRMSSGRITESLIPMKFNSERVTADLCYQTQGNETNLSH